MSPGGNCDRCGCESGGSSDQIGRWLKVDYVADAVGGSHSLEYTIIQDFLHFWEGYDG
jgi:hypothetical protein